LEDKLEEIKSVSQKYGISTDSAKEKIQEKIDEKNQREEESYNWDDERPTGNLESDSQDLQIESMFDSLRDTERLSD
jgi:hypothetical protein